MSAAIVAGPVRRRDAGRGAVPVVHADGERGALGLGVGRDHQWQVEQVGPLGQQRHADHARRVGQEEGDLLRRGRLGRHHEVPLVLPVLVVHHDDHAELADGLDGLFDGSRTPSGGHLDPKILSELRNRHHSCLSTRLQLCQPRAPRKAGGRRHRRKARARGRSRTDRPGLQRESRGPRWHPLRPGAAARRGDPARPARRSGHPRARGPGAPSPPRAPCPARRGAVGRRRGTSTSRTVSSGSSARTVPAPTSTASEWARRRWTSRRAASPVIQRLVPSGAAVRPSRLAAIFSTTQGWPVLRCLTYGASCSATSSAATPSVTSMPAARRAATPRPATRAVGVLDADDDPGDARLDDGVVQGGVRPWWAHGSSVT